MKFLLFTVIMAMGLSMPAQAQPSRAEHAEVIRLNTRPNTEQAYLLLRQAPPPGAVAVLITGGYGLLKLQGEGDGIRWNPQGSSYVVINRLQFLDDATAVAIVDVPTDQWSIGATPKFRKSAEHATDLRAVVADLRTRFPAARIFLIGTSQGSTSAAFVGKALGKEVDGVALTASVFAWAPASWGHLSDSNLSDFDFAQIQAPLLIVHHRDDPCAITPYAPAAELGAKFPLITVSGGLPVQDKGCGPRGPHGFLGREREVAVEILNWMHGRPFRREIP